MADGDDNKIERDVKGGLIPGLIQLLLSAQVVTLVLRALGNIVTRTDTQTDAVIQSGALTLLAKLTTRLWTNSLCKSDLEGTTDKAMSSTAKRRSDIVHYSSDSSDTSDTSDENDSPINRDTSGGPRPKRKSSTSVKAKSDENNNLTSAEEEKDISG